MNENRRLLPFDFAQGKLHLNTRNDTFGKYRKVNWTFMNLKL